MDLWLNLAMKQEGTTKDWQFSCSSLLAEGSNRNCGKTFQHNHGPLWRWCVITSQGLCACTSPAPIFFEPHSLKMEVPGVNDDDVVFLQEKVPPKHQGYRKFMKVPIQHQFLAFPGLMTFQNVSNVKCVHHFIHVHPNSQFPDFPTHSPYEGQLFQNGKLASTSTQGSK